MTSPQNQDESGDLPEGGAAEVQNTMIDWGSSDMHTGSMNKPHGETRRDSDPHGKR
jgi:hypothetical protein